MKDVPRGIQLRQIGHFAKADKVGRGARAATRERAAKTLGLADPDPLLFVSAETGEGLAELWQALLERLRSAPPTDQSRLRREDASQ